MDKVHSFNVKHSAVHNIHKVVAPQPPSVDFGPPGITKKGAFNEQTAKPRITTGTNRPGEHVMEAEKTTHKMHSHNPVSAGGHVSVDTRNG